MHKAESRSEEGSCGSNSWSPASGNLRLSRKSLYEFEST